MNIAWIVGNGPSALDSPMGPIIDCAQHVYRCNNFETDGFEKHVGTRTTGWIRNGGHRITARPVVDDILIAHPWPDGRMTKAAIEAFTDALSIAGNAVAMSSRILVDELKEAANMRSGDWPSTGLIGLWWAMKRHPIVHITGFDCFHGTRAWYYHKRRLSPRGYARQNPQAELAMIGRLERDGRIKVGA